MNIEIVKMFSW